MQTKVYWQFFSIFAAGLLFFSASSIAQPRSSAQQKPDTGSVTIPVDMVNKLILEFDEKKTADSTTAGISAMSADQPEDKAMPKSPGIGALDRPTFALYLKAMREYYTYHISGLHHRKRVVEWQHVSSRIIFFVVWLLVFAGIYFAAVQFHYGMHRKFKEKPSTGEERTEFVASFKGIKVSSPVLGVVILVISLVFFYLYLSYVYPIQETF